MKEVQKNGEKSIKIEIRYLEQFRDGLSEKIAGNISRDKEEYGLYKQWCLRSLCLVINRMVECR